MLYDTAATLALELAADGSHRPATLTKTVILPGSGDTFAVTVSAGGQASYKIEHDGRAGSGAAPGAEAVVAAYAKLLGHAPSQDELAGFLAARVAGGALPGGAATPTTEITARAANGQVLATGTPSALLAALATPVVLNNGVTPIFDLPDHPPLQNATEAAACLLGLTVQAGTTTAPLVATYDTTIRYFDAIDQPMLQVAAHWAAQTKSDAGNAARVTLDQTAEQLALRIAAEPEGARSSLTEQVRVDGHRTDVTVSQTTTDVTGGAQFHDLSNFSLGQVVEQVVGAVADVLSFTPLAPVAAPVAAGIAAAEAGQSFADGNALGGVLDLGAVAGFGLDAAGSVVAASETLAGTALVGGVAGTVQGAENGDGLGLAAGLLQAAAAASAGIATYEGGASDAFKSVIAGLGAASAGASIADAAEHGGLQNALLAGLGPLLGAIASAVQQANAAPNAEARVDQKMSSILQAEGAPAGSFMVAEGADDEPVGEPIGPEGRPLTPQEELNSDSYYVAYNALQEIDPNNPALGPFLRLC